MTDFEQSDGESLAEHLAEKTAERLAEMQSTMTVRRFKGIQTKCAECGELMSIDVQTIANHQFATKHKWMFTVGKE